MASYTAFLNLEKPTTSERLDVLKINSNWDKIDAGVSALNSHLEPVEILATSYPLPSTETSFPCAWKNYRLLIFAWCFYNSVIMTNVVPASVFDGTTTNRVIYLSTTQEGYVVKNGDNAVIIKNSSGNQYVQVKVWGVL